MTRHDKRMTPAEISVRHGYTLADLDDLARRVVRNAMTWFRGGDRHDQRDTAWFGIVEHLCAAEHEPTRIELMEAGRRALTNEVRAIQQTHGTRRDSSNDGSGFGRYWTWHSGPTPSPETAVVERIALGQVLPVLANRHREAFAILAATEDYRASAAVLGIPKNTFCRLISDSRRAFDALWFEGESAPRRRRDDRARGRTDAEIQARADAARRELGLSAGGDDD